MRWGNDVYADIVGNKERINARYQDVECSITKHRPQASDILEAFVKIKHMKLASETTNLSLNALHTIYNEIINL